MQRTEELQINMGPQHPSTHGVLRIILNLDGEWITGARLDLGFLHRAFEKMAELRTYYNYVPLTDRWDYISAMTNNLVYCMAVEKLMGLQVPRRAEYLRVIMAELNRIASHLVFAGTFGLDTGANTPFLYCFRERERILALFEEICGARLTYTYMRIGGVGSANTNGRAAPGDAPDGWFGRVEAFLDDLPGRLDELDDLLTNNEIFQARTRGVGIISRELAISQGLSGPMLRASGVDWDLRRDQPYSIYSELQFVAEVRQGGDCLDRYLCRFSDMRESIEIVRQCLRQIPEGEVMATVPKVIKPPPGDVYAAIEPPRGELGVYLVSDGSEVPYRMKIRGPSFVNLSVLPHIVKGWKVADVVLILGSTDIVMGEVDR